MLNPSVVSGESKQEMGALQRSCQEFMRLCKVHLFNGCQKWQRTELQLWRGQSLGSHHCQTLVMPFEEGSELITSLNGMTGSTAQCPKLSQAPTPLCPFCPWRELRLKAPWNQQSEGREARLFCVASGQICLHFGSPPAPSVCRYLLLFLPIFLIEKSKHLVFILNFKQAN